MESIPAFDVEDVYNVLPVVGFWGEYSSISIGVNDPSARQFRRFQLRKHIMHIKHTKAGRSR